MNDGSAWNDGTGYGCAEYGGSSGPSCGPSGLDGEPLANEACCDCGGGLSEDAMPATCADGQKLAACTAALQAAGTECYGIVDTDCSAITGSQCLTSNIKTGDTMGTDVATFDYTMQSGCTNAIGCEAMKVLYPDSTCGAEGATSCPRGLTCGAGSMATVSMSAVLFALCAALYQL
jgi:hypothetical protein